MKKIKILALITVFLLIDKLNEHEKQIKKLEKKIKKLEGKNKKEKEKC